MFALTVGGRSTRSKAPARASAVLLGVLAALAAWLVLAAAMGGLHQPAFGGGDPQQVGAPAVALASLAGGLLGWAALVVAERLSRNGRMIWLPVVVVGAFLSLIGPASGAGVGTGDRFALALLHLAVAGVVIPLLYRTTTRSEAHRPEVQR